MLTERLAGQPIESVRQIFADIIRDMGNERKLLAETMQVIEENIAAVAALLGEYGVRHVDVLPCHSFGSGKYRALSRPVPDVREFSPAGLHVALERFAAQGLETEIV